MDEARFFSLCGIRIPAIVERLNRDCSTGLGITGIASRQNQRKFRKSDELASLSHELFDWVKSKNGYYHKVSGSRDIAPHLKMDGSNQSPRFNVLLLDGIRAWVARMLI